MTLRSYRNSWGLGPEAVLFSTHLALEFLDTPDLDFVCKPLEGGTESQDLRVVRGNDTW